MSKYWDEFKVFLAWYEFYSHKTMLKNPFSFGICHKSVRPTTKYVNPQDGFLSILSRQAWSCGPFHVYIYLLLYSAAINSSRERIAMQPRVGRLRKSFPWERITHNVKRILPNESQNVPRTHTHIAESSFLFSPELLLLLWVSDESIHVFLSSSSSGLIAISSYCALSVCSNASGRV